MPAFKRLPAVLCLLAWPLLATAAPELPGYLLVHFTGEGADGEQIHFALSGDGLRFTDLNGSRPVLASSLGDWTILGDLRAIGLTGKDVEGPILYRMPASNQWGLWVDQYATHAGYLALVSDDLSQPARFRRADPASVSYGASKKRHGSILNISDDEYRRVLAKWPATAQP